MLLLRLAQATIALFDTLSNVAAGNRTVRAHVVGCGGRHLAEYRPAYLHRIREKFTLDAPGAIVARTALHRVDLGPRYEFEHLARLLPHVLHTQVAGNVIRNLAQRRLEILVQQPVPVAHD